MLKNGKFFLPPPGDESDFKELFKRIAASGAGQTVGKDGFPSGPWTPELLAAAITEIGANRAGVDIRTVQIWFQDNRKGISPTNIRWLARVLGCDDPIATSEWQIALSEAQSRLTHHRRDQRVESKNMEEDRVELDDAGKSAELVGHEEAAPRQSLALRTEMLFSRGSPLDLPSAVFAGAVALGFLSYLLTVHSINYDQGGGTFKQVGFLWAPNWTLVFMVLMPLFFAFIVDSLAYWRSNGRQFIIGAHDRAGLLDSWPQTIEKSSYTYWAVFIICILFAGFLQWIGVRLRSILGDSGAYAPDWGTYSNMRPDVVSAFEEIFFTGIAYAYMSVCFYLFFSGLIIIYTMAYDFWKIDILNKSSADRKEVYCYDLIAFRIMSVIFRCSVLGLLIASCMKLQAFYLASSGRNIVSWLTSDFVSVFRRGEAVTTPETYSMPTHYSSFIVALATSATFLYGSIRLSAGSRFQGAFGRMATAITLLWCAYVTIGTFSGHSILLGIGTLLALYGLLDPAYGGGSSWKARDNQSVS